MSALRREVAAEAGRFVLANLASAIASGLEWLVVSALVLAGAHYLFAAGAGAVTGAVTDFSLKRHCAFGRRGRAAVGLEGSRYVWVSAVSLVLNLALAYWLVDRLRVPPLPGVIGASIVLAVAWNYPLHRWYVFRPVRKG